MTGPTRPPGVLLSPRWVQGVERDGTLRDFLVMASRHVDVLLGELERFAGSDAAREDPALIQRVRDGLREHRDEMVACELALILTGSWDGEVPRWPDHAHDAEEGS